MALDFPTTVKLREEEHRAVLRLIGREPLLSRAEAAIGALIIGLRIVEGPDGFQELLGVLRARKQGAELLAQKKPPESERVERRRRIA